MKVCKGCNMDTVCACVPVCADEFIGVMVGRARGRGATGQETAWPAQGAER